MQREPAGAARQGRSWDGWLRSFRAPARGPAESRVQAPVANGIFVRASRYLLSAASVAAALGGALAFERFGFIYMEFPLFLFAVASTVWYPGIGPAILAVVLSSLAFNFFFLEPRYTLSLAASDLPYYVAFVLFSLMLTWFSVVRRNSERDLLASREQLRLEMAERKRHEEHAAALSGELERVRRVAAERALQRTEAYLAESQRLTHTGSWAFDPALGKPTYWSDETFRIFGLDPAGKCPPDREALLLLIHPDDRAVFAASFEQAVANQASFKIDYRIVLPDGTLKHLHQIGHPIVDDGGRLVEYVGTEIDVTERRLAEAEHRAHVWFLESLDRINRAIQGASDLERMMSDALEGVLDVFACDRAWLAYPCDPRATHWQAVLEHTRPGIPRTFDLGRPVPVDASLAAGFAVALAAGSPVDPGPHLYSEQPPEGGEFAVRAQIAMAVPPKGDAPYLFGLHQCSRERVWTVEERRLFQEIGRRLADALTSLLVFRRLREGERKLEAAQRIARVGWWERDFRTHHVQLSPEVFRTFGLQAVDLPQWQERWLQLIHPDDRERVAAAAAAALQGGPRYEVEYRVVRPDGAVRVVHSQGDVTRDESGQPLRQFGVLQDITALRRAEDEWRASESRFRTFVDHASDAFFLLDDETLAVIDVNRQACESLGYGRDELIGMHPRDFDAGLDASVMTRFKAQIQAGEVVTFETHHRRRDGRVFPVEIRARWFRQGDRNLHLCLVRDITERKRAETALRERDDALQVARAELAHVTRVTMLGELTASIAHEVNQPLGAMVANAAACVRWLAAEPPAVAKARTALEGIAADGRRAGEIIGRIRALTKRQVPRKAPVDLNEAILEVVALARYELDRHAIVLETLLAPGLPRVPGDKVQLQQVALNLVINAIDAMSTIADRPRVLSIASGPEGPDAVFVEVRDSGSGVDGERAEKLFEPFYTTKAEGLGIGLSISRSIVEAHGGALVARPNAPHGAIFRFSLPTSE